MIPKTLEAPSNCWTFAEQSFVNAIVASTAFSDIVEGENAADYVFLEEVSKDGTEYTIEELEDLRHYAIVTSQDEDPYGSEFGPSRTHSAFGTVELVVRRLVRESERTDTNPEIPMRWFKNRVGYMIKEFPDYMWVEGGPVLKQVLVDFGPRETTEMRQPTQGLWLTCHLSIEWGFVNP